MRRITMLALVAVLALIGAACGGDDDSGSGDEDTTTTTDGGDDGGSTDDGGDAEATDLGDLIDDDCEFLLAGAFLNPMVAAQSGEADFDGQAEQLQEIADAAPDEIQDAMNTLAESFDEIAELFQDIDFSDQGSLQDPDTLAAFQELEQVADEEYQAAVEEVSTWMTENCTAATVN